MQPPLAPTARNIKISPSKARAGPSDRGTKRKRNVVTRKYADKNATFGTTREREYDVIMARKEDRNGILVRIDR